MIELPRLASLVFGQAHHITPDAAEVILRVLGDRIGIDAATLARLSDPEPQSNAWAGAPAYDRDKKWRGYRVTERGAAIVEVHGELVNRGSWLGSSSGLVSYEGLRQTLRNAASDRSVRTIVLDIDSPGGMAVGMTDTASLVREIDAEKPVHVVANGLAASAAYGIASGATRIVLGETARVGSIGTLWMHVDRSRQIDKQGLTVSILHEGARKVDGHPFAPLPDSVRADIQEGLAKMQTLFVRSVAAGRGLDERAIRDTEARVYMGQDAVAAGLADDVGSFESALADAEAGTIKPRTRVTSTPPPNHQESPGMPTGQQPGAQPGPASAISAAALDDALAALRQRLAGGDVTASQAPADTPPAQPVAVAPVAQAPAPVETADAAYARGRLEERSRCKAIMALPEAKERPAQAALLAFETDRAPEAAATLLAAGPVEAQPAGSTLAPHLAARSSFFGAVRAAGGDPRVAHLGDVSSAAPTAAPSPGLAAAMSKVLATSMPKKGVR